MREASLLAEVSIVFQESLREGEAFPSLITPESLKPRAMRSRFFFSQIVYHNIVSAPKVRML